MSVSKFAGASQVLEAIQHLLAVLGTMQGARRLGCNPRHVWRIYRELNLSSASGFIKCAYQLLSVWESETIDFMSMIVGFQWF